MSDTVLDLIDGALASYGDAMRWSPDPPRPALNSWQEAILDQLPVTTPSAGFCDPFTPTSVHDFAVSFEHLGQTITGTGQSLGVLFDEVKRFLASDVVAAHRAREAAAHRARLSRMRSMYRKRNR